MSAERCPKCAGSGRDPDAPADQRVAPCPACGGTGETMPGQLGLDAMRVKVGPPEVFRMAIE